MSNVKTDEIRNRIQANINGVTTNSLQLAWDLAVVRAEELWRKWQFGSFPEWATTDLGKHCSRSHAYDLSDIGRYFWAEKSRLEQYVQEKRVGIKQLIDLTRVAKQTGLPLKEAMASIERGEPIAPTSKDTEDLDCFEVFLPRGDMENFRHSLMLHAVHSGNASLNESIIDMVLGNLAPLEEKALPKGFKEFYEEIMAGTFYCKLCQKIPREPTYHHPVPVSLVPDSVYQRLGWGKVLLCWPCHQKVQPQWRLYAEKWFGKRKLEELRREAEKELGKKISFDEAA